MTQQSIKFLHLRRTHARRESDIWNGGSSKFLSTGGATVAYVQDITGAVRLAYAKCSEDDLYCKERGRQLALERLQAWQDPKWLRVVIGASHPTDSVASWAKREGLA